MKNCCSLRLNTAGIVVGIFYSAVSLLIAIFGIEYLVDFLSNENTQRSAGLIWTSILIVAFSAIGLICSSLLVCGTFKKRHRFLIPWLAFAALLIIFFFLVLSYYIYDLIAIIYHKNRFDYSSLLTILIIIGFLALNIYLWKCILQLYENIKTENEEKQTTVVLKSSQPVYPDLYDFSKMTEIDLN